MPIRSETREQGWLLPPSLGDLVPADHPARFIAAFVEALDGAAWADLGIAPGGAERGAPAYAPRLLLSVWLYGFLIGVRSARKLEVACREQVPLLWLTGLQHPDHNTLWRFYQAHRRGLRELLKRTVRTAVQLGLVDLALQAVDGTKVGASAASDRMLTTEGLRHLLERTEAAIADLEAQNATGGPPPVPSLPQRLACQRELRQRVAEALAVVTAEAGPERANVTDPQAHWMKGRQGIAPAYNAQAMVAALDPAVAGETGLLLTAAEVVTAANDNAQLVPLIEAAQAQTGVATPPLTLGDGGYCTGPALATCAARGWPVLVPAGPGPTEETPYHKDNFRYDAATDSYICPHGQTLTFRRLTERPEHLPAREYRCPGRVCRACPAFGTCTKDKNGRTLKLIADEPVLRAQRARMAQSDAQALYLRRKELAEPAFGILKEVQAARRFLLRGLAAVQAEWSLLATAFNLRTLWRVWRRRPAATRGELVGAATG